MFEAFSFGLKRKCKTENGTKLKIGKVRIQNEKNLKRKDYKMYIPSFESDRAQRANGAHISHSRRWPFTQMKIMHVAVCVCARTYTSHYHAAVARQCDTRRQTNNFRVVVASLSSISSQMRQLALSHRIFDNKYSGILIGFHSRPATAARRRCRVHAFAFTFVKEDYWGFCTPYTFRFRYC